MKEKNLYLIWGCLYILCAGLGFINGAAGFGKFLLVLMCLIFFIPGGLLLYQGIQANNKAQLRRLRTVAAVSLGLTLLALVANVFSVLASEAVGNILYVILVLVSAPMMCGQYWVLSMFLWACLLMGSFLKSPKTPA